MSYQFIYSGPLLFKSSLSKEDCLALLKICNNNKKVKYNKNLAGVINEEYKIENLEAVKIILNKYFDEIVIAVSNWYSFSPKQVILKSAWTNYMKAGEFNPPHIHSNCKFSSVFYLQVPEKISKESKNFIREYHTYYWDQMKDGTIINKPVDKNNHLMDALRYCVYSAYGKGVDFFVI